MTETPLAPQAVEVLANAVARGRADGPVRIGTFRRTGEATIQRLVADRQPGGPA